MCKRILVVDDDAMNLKRTRMILEKHYNVLLAESGREALSKIKSEKIDLILLDIAMPIMDGIETFKRMKVCLTFYLHQYYARRQTKDKLFYTLHVRDIALLLYSFLFSTVCLAKHTNAFLF